MRSQTLVAAAVIPDPAAFLRINSFRYSGNFTGTSCLASQQEEIREPNEDSRTTKIYCALHTDNTTSLSALAA
eukprot:COSAG01_NODE_2139_length_8323_cov_13.355788_7_plen_73_part_00